MSLLDTASLLLTPNAYKEGKLYSVIPSDGSGDFTFTRATTATRVNSDGLVELVPYNLLTYSEQFDNAIWTKSSVTIIPNDATAPNGTLTADKLYPTSSGNFRHVRQSAFSPYTGLNTMSIYAKKAELSNLTLIDYDGSGAGINYNLNTGVATDYATTPFVSYSMTAVGDGWYRCTATALNGYFYWMVTDGGNSVAVTANGTDGLFIWGAQLVEGTNALPYQKTETRLNIPRLDYSLGGCPNILLEPQRTNLLQRSEEFNNAYWNKNGGSISANSSTAPNGTLTADRLTLAATTTTHGLIDFGVGGVAASTYTVSFYVKKGTHRYITIGIYRNTLNNAGAGFDLDTNTVTGTGATGTGYSASGATMTDVGDGWYRCSVVCVSGTTPMTGSGLFLRNTSYTSGAIQESWAASGTETINLWGAQAEVGAYATSYIPTTIASVTRNNDVCVKTGATALIGQTEGVFYAEINGFLGDNTSRDISIYSTSFGTYNNYLRIQLRNITNLVRFAIVANGLTIRDFSTTIVQNNFNKIAVKYSQSGYSFWINGVKVDDGVNACDFQLLDSFRTSSVDGSGPFNGNINSIQLYKTALTDDQLEQLTTL